jgi:hypothetical protein
MWELSLHILVECRLSENFPTGTFSTLQYSGSLIFQEFKMETLTFPQNNTPFGNGLYSTNHEPYHCKINYAYTDTAYTFQQNFRKF